MPVTLRDVAARAGVSPVVVSKVLHNKAESVRVSEATAARVRQAAQDLGYRVNVFARNFRSQRTMTLGLLNGFPLSRPYFSFGSRYFPTLMDGIVEGAFARKYSVTLCPELFELDPEQASSDGRFDGLLWYSASAAEKERDLILSCRTPLVLIHSRMATFENKHSTVICDNVQAVRLGVDHLLAQGFTDLAYAVPYSTIEFRQRADIFTAYCDLKGVKHRLIEDNSQWNEPIMQFVHGDKGSRKAIFAAHDGVAGDIMELLHSQGVSIPRDCGMLGFDSTGFCNELRPTLSSVSQPLFQMGEAAVMLLLRQIDEHSAPEELIFPCGIDVRESTAR